MYAVRLVCCNMSILTSYCYQAVVSKVKSFMLEGKPPRGWKRFLKQLAAASPAPGYEPKKVIRSSVRGKVEVITQSLCCILGAEVWQGAGCDERGGQTGGARALWYADGAVRLPGTVAEIVLTIIGVFFTEQRIIPVHRWSAKETRHRSMTPG
jgi:hypothetical protein